MRIFQLLEATTNASVPQNCTWLRCLHEPLLDLGHQVELMSTEKGRLARQTNSAKLRGDFSQAVIEAFRKEHKKRRFDLFFSYLTDGMIEPAVVDEIRACGVPTCNFSCNNVHQFHLVAKISKHYDYSLHAEQSVAAKFVSVGANPLWWPMGSNPKYFKPYNVERSIPVSFVGANYALRARYVSHLLENGVDVRVYGPTWRYGARSPARSVLKRLMLLTQVTSSWDVAAAATASARLAEHDFNRRLSAEYFNNLHPPISDEGMIRLYSASQVSLGFLEVHDGNDPSQQIHRHLHLRDFEAPMCGALYCVGFMEEMSHFFEPDSEVIVYRNDEELLGKIRYYLNHPAEAEAIRKAGHARALAHHTSHARYRDLFAKIGLPS